MAPTGDGTGTTDGVAGDPFELLDGAGQWDAGS
jgi:hypothetical protein